MIFQTIFSPYCPFYQVGIHVFKPFRSIQYNINIRRVQSFLWQEY